MEEAAANENRGAWPAALSSSRPRWFRRSLSGILCGLSGTEPRGF